MNNDQRYLIFIFVLDYIWFIYSWSFLRGLRFDCVKLLVKPLMFY